jgi:hypothetical protein
MTKIYTLYVEYSDRPSRFDFERVYETEEAREDDMKHYGCCWPSDPYFKEDALEWPEGFKAMSYTKAETTLSQSIGVPGFSNKPQVIET